MRSMSATTTSLGPLPIITLSIGRISRIRSGRVAAVRRSSATEILRTNVLTAILATCGPRLTASLATIASEIADSGTGNRSLHDAHRGHGLRYGGRGIEQGGDDHAYQTNHAQGVRTAAPQRDDRRRAGVDHPSEHRRREKPEDPGELSAAQNERAHGQWRDQ